MLIARQRTEQTTKLTISGFAPSWRNTNFADPAMEVWGINSLYTFFEQIKGSHMSRLYDLHRSQYIKQQDDDGTHIPKLRELAKNGTQIFTCEECDFLPEANVYPLDEVEKMVGICYFTNTISYLVLHACLEKQKGYWPQLEELHIVGCDMAQDGEYAHQRPSVEMAIGFARGMGLKVFIDPTSDICRSIYKYGFDTNPIESKLFKDKIDNHKQQLAELNTNRQKLVDWRNSELSKIETHFNKNINVIDSHINQLKGAIQMSTYYSRAVFAQNNNNVSFSPQLGKYEGTDWKEKDLFDE